ncbi:helix-turn-helix transcriptional regulator [Microvirga flavescens]|uniref:helix-turn-helix transcriptional regulator n=1 Tax=Microvirga flavescens TaxID=2249811 RepID=UPI000DDA8052|nr:helix-turn-helix transcriptional regulator [Microvirga flavescens]
MVTVRQVKAARAMLGWSQDQLAAASGISKPTIARLETSDGEIGGYTGTRDKLIAALEAAGVIFIAENGEGPGVRLRKQRGGDAGLRPDHVTSENDG